MNFMGAAHGTIIELKNQCWALAPFSAPPCHWRELKKLADVAVARGKKIGVVAVVRKYNGANLRHL